MKTPRITPANALLGTALCTIGFVLALAPAASADELPPNPIVARTTLIDMDVLAGFDPEKEAGGPLRSVVKEFKGVRVKKDLVITLTPTDDAPVKASVLCGIEIRAEGW